MMFLSGPSHRTSHIQPWVFYLFDSSGIERTVWVGDVVDVGVDGGV